MFAYSPGKCWKEIALQPAPSVTFVWHWLGDALGVCGAAMCHVKLYHHINTIDPDFSYPWLALVTA